MRVKVAALVIRSTLAVVRACAARSLGIVAVVTAGGEGGEAAVFGAIVGGCHTGARRCRALRLQEHHDCRR